MKLKDFVQILDDISENFTFLDKYGFAIKNITFDSEMMDYWEIILYSFPKKICIKLSSDRGELFASFCSMGQKPYTWLELDQLIYTMSDFKEFIGSYEGDLSNMQLQIERVNSYLKKYIVRIVDFFDEDNYEKYRHKFKSIRQELNAIYLEKHSK